MIFSLASGEELEALGGVLGVFVFDDRQRTRAYSELLDQRMSNTWCSLFAYCWYSM